MFLFFECRNLSKYVWGKYYLHLHNSINLYESISISSSLRYEKFYEIFWKKFTLCFWRKICNCDHLMEETTVSACVHQQQYFSHSFYMMKRKYNMSIFWVEAWVFCPIFNCLYNFFLQFVNFYQKAWLWRHNHFLESKLPELFWHMITSITISPFHWFK